MKHKEEALIERGLKSPGQGGPKAERLKFRLPKVSTEGRKR
ncbi:hypothetical protein [Desulfospira joergensenii]|nr:hypothetical protein [Desulfospira joergensenii]